MSPKLRSGLLIGGLTLVSLIICGVLLAFVVAPASRAVRGGVSSQVSRNDAAWAYDGAVRDEMGVAESPAEAPAAMPDMDMIEAEEAAVGMGGGAGGEIEPQDIDPQQQRIIIRNGSISMSVNNTLEARDAIQQRIEQMTGEGAFVVSANEYGGSPGGSPIVEMSVRVPAARFDETMAWLASLAVRGTNPNISTSADDVTSEYVDVRARLESLEAARDRLLELMENAATTEELLMAEQQLTQREAEIESLKGRLQYLTESARLSFIRISLQPYVLSQPVDTRWRPAETMREAVEALLAGMRDFGDFVIFLVIAVLPWLLAVGLVLFAIIRFFSWRARVRRERAGASGPPAAE